MTKKEVLKHLDELVRPMMTSRHQWTKDEAIAMQVQTFRTYRLVAQKHGIHETTVKRMCVRVINKVKVFHVVSGEITEIKATNNPISEWVCFNKKEEK